MHLIQQSACPGQKIKNLQLGVQRYKKKDANWSTWINLVQKIANYLGCNTKHLKIQAHKKLLTSYLYISSTYNNKVNFALIKQVTDHSLPLAFLLKLSTKLQSASWVVGQDFGLKYLFLNTLKVGSLWKRRLMKNETGQNQVKPSATWRWRRSSFSVS